MNKEDSLQFVHERLRHNHHAGLVREFGLLHERPRITRRFAIELGEGEAHKFELLDPSFSVRCARGSVWITHDGDPKDVILVGGEEYRTERSDPMHLYALVPTILEIEFEDEVTQH
jgi:hypothetical protein